MEILGSMFFSNSAHISNIILPVPKLTFLCIIESDSSASRTFGRRETSWSRMSPSIVNVGIILAAIGAKALRIIFGGLPITIAGAKYNN